MKNFSDFNITLDTFTGKKIEMDEILDQQVEVIDFKIEKSKFPGKGNGMRLTLQIKYEGKDRVVFTGSVILQEQCIKVKEVGGFPFTTKIIALKPRGFKFT